MNNEHDEWSRIVAVLSADPALARAGRGDRRRVVLWGVASGLCLIGIVVAVALDAPLVGVGCYLAALVCALRALRAWRLLPPASDITL